MPDILQNHVEAYAAARKFADLGTRGKTGLEDEHAHLLIAQQGVGDDETAFDGAGPHKRGIDSATILGNLDYHPS